MPPEKSVYSRTAYSTTPPSTSQPGRSPPASSAFVVAASRSAITIFLKYPHSSSWNPEANSSGSRRCPVISCAPSSFQVEIGPWVSWGKYPMNSQAFSGFFCASALPRYTSIRYPADWKVK